jgi:hypothetical protein
MIALRETGGVMLFDVNEDSEGDLSALSMIDDTLAVTEGLRGEELDGYIWVVVDNKAIPFTGKDGFGVPFIDKNGRTLVPFRRLLESIGAEVGYTADEDGRVRSVEASLGGTRIVLNIGDSRYSVNGESLTMDTAAALKEGRTYIPVRPVLEAFGYGVSYSEAGKSVYAVSEEPSLKNGQAS